ncbi:CD209 antigen-like protein A [Aplochiton taeniatus]
MDIQNITVQRDELNISLTRVSRNRANVTGPDDWEHYSGSCYSFFAIKQTWDESQYACISDGGHLVIIETEGEQEFLRQKVGTADFSNSYWIGLTDVKQEGVWVWMNNRTLINGTASKYWDHKEPNNNDSGQPENCALIGQVCNIRINCWFDNRCNRKAKRVCESHAAY